MTQTLALLLDAYRDLNSRKLFWVTLLISAAFVGALAMIGVEPEALTFLKWRWEMLEPSLFYRSVILTGVIVGMWLSWGAVLLALISTAGIFPDLIASGSIDLYLSKPISRLRLFLTKYLLGLLFVALQVSIFCLGCFLVLGLRLHEWRLGILLAIPLITLLFSYIFSFCVLIGTWTRSSMAALLLAIMLWTAFSGVTRTNKALWIIRTGLETSIQHNREDIKNSVDQPPRYLFDLRPGLLRKRREEDQRQIEEFTSVLQPVSMFQNIIGGAEALLPKTIQTNDLLDRHLLSEAESTDRAAAAGGTQPILNIQPRELQAASIQYDAMIRGQSPAFVIGSSLACEAVVLALAAWIFCRRDY